MRVLQFVKTIIPTSFIISASTTYINTVLPESIDSYDCIEIKLEYEFNGFGLCLYQSSRLKGDTDTTGYYNFGWADKGVLNYNVRLKNTTCVIQGAITRGSIKRMWINLYKYEDIAQTITETRVITESSQLATIFAENVQVQKDILAELKNQSINLELQGRFIGASAKIWDIDNQLQQDEYIAQKQWLIQEQANENNEGAL